MKKTSKIIKIVLISLVIGFLLFKKDVQGYDLAMENSQLEYDEIQDVIDHILSKDNQFSFSEYISDLISGKEIFSYTEVINKIKEGVVIELKSNTGNFTALIAIAIIAAVFTNLSAAFKNNQVADTG